MSELRLVVNPTPVLYGEVQDTIAGLWTEAEREEAEVYWEDHQALILVPGEKGVRKQQIIIVTDNDSCLSAKVGNWAVGVRDTAIK